MKDVKSPLGDPVCDPPAQTQPAATNHKEICSQQNVPEAGPEGNPPRTDVGPVASESTGGRLSYPEALAKVKEHLCHPACSVFPLMGEGDLSALAEDILAHGQHESIETFEGTIADGRNRVSSQ
jgi:hypothetical protein